MNIHFDLDGQTAPESTRGFFELETPSSRKNEWTDKCRSVELSPRVHNKSFTPTKQQSNRNSGLHTVNEEDFYHQRQKNDNDSPPIFQRKQRSSVAHFNNFPIGKNLDDNPNQLSRADVLAETEAKLNGQKLPLSNYRPQFDQEQKQNRRLSEPTGSRVYHQYNQYQQKTDDQRPLYNNLNKRMSFQLNSSRVDDKRHSLSRLNFMDMDKRSSMRDWRSKSPTSSGTTTPVLSSSSTSLSSRPNSTVGLMNYHRLSTGSSIMDGSNGHQRKPLFTSHMPFSSVVPHLKSNLLVSGLLRVNKRNRSDAYVFCEELNADIYICGSRDRNRALEGDHVAVKLIEVKQVMFEKHEKEEAKLVRNNGNPVIRKPDEEDEKQIIFGGEEDVDIVTPRFCGVVVAILDRAQKQVFSGTLGLTRPSNKRSKAGSNDDSNQRDSSKPRIIWFKPTDKRVPLIAIPVEQAPPGFIENSEAFENRLFLGSIKRWPITSLHPFGVLENELGLVDDMHVQVQAILADNSLAHPPFSDALLDTIPMDLLNQDMIDEELANNLRTDFRSHRCITIIDEEGGFMENALSVTCLADGSFEVGFHVSDITAFIPADSPLDKEARTRGMDVYHTIAEKVPLWPDELKRNCTDLVANEDRLAVSLVWNIQSNGKVTEAWIGKTVIHSTAALTLREIQDMLDSSEETENDLESDVVSLYTVAQLLNRERSEQALFIKTPQLDIQFDNEPIPTNISAKQPLDADVILSEFQILANTQVAQKISSHFPDHALLRSQSAPNERKLSELTRYLSGLGYTIDPESPSSLQKSINSVDNEEARSVITALVIKTLSQSKYFCTGAFDINRYHHYSTNSPLYTHFSSPSKRYADIIVHRQLDAYLRDEPYFYMDPEIVQKTAQNCNVKTRSLENAHEQTQHLFLSWYLANISSSRIEDAIVVGVQDHAFDVIVPGLGLERRIHTINLPLKADTFSPSENVLHLVWIQGKATVDAGIETSYSDDDELEDEDVILVDISDEDETTKKNRRRSTSIRAVQGEDAALTQKECTFPDECRQLIRPFDFVKVVVTADPIRSPPLIRILAANPFLTK